MVFGAAELAALMFTVNGTDRMSPESNTALIGIATVLMPLFITCKMSELVTERLQTVGDGFYEFSW